MHIWLCLRSKPRLEPMRLLRIYGNWLWAFWFLVFYFVKRFSEFYARARRHGCQLSASARSRRHRRGRQPLSLSTSRSDVNFTATAICCGLCVDVSTNVNWKGLTLQMQRMAYVSSVFWRTLDSSNNANSSVMSDAIPMKKKSSWDSSDLVISPRGRTQRLRS